MKYPELERNIYSCRSIIVELQTLQKEVSDDNYVADALADICAKYDCRFEALCETFEEVLFDSIHLSAELSDNRIQEIDLTSI